MQWYCKRGDASENRIKDLKIGFGMEYMPCGTFQANATFFAIGVLTYNLYLGFRSVALGKEWERTQVQTVRWRLFQTAGKIKWTSQDQKFLRALKITVDEERSS